MHPYICTMESPVLLWFRQDLRLADNPALHAAAGRPLLAVYVLDDEAAGAWAHGGASRWWLHHTLAALDAALARHTDRRTSQLSPLEHAALMIGAYELTHCLEVPYRVALNEAVELAKAFGGTDGHKFVNGVMDKLAARLRPEEVEAARAAKR